MGVIFNRLLKRFDLGKCVFCGLSGNLSFIEKYGIYCEANWFYHQGCLLDIICEPENYDNNKIDMAILIGDAIKEENRKDEICEFIRKTKLSTLCEEIKEINANS